MILEWSFVYSHTKKHHRNRNIEITNLLHGLKAEREINLHLIRNDMIEADQ